jgi:TorA maturation chaperone TorD
MEALRALGALAEPPGEAAPGLAAALDLPGVPAAHEFTEIFIFQLYPYASVYLGPEGMLGGEARDRVAGFWRALGLTPPAEPDHLAALLSLYAALAERGEDVRRALLWEHLLTWLVPYLDRMREVGGTFYGPWATALADLLASEARTAGPPDLEPLHLRSAPDLPDPRDQGADAFLGGLIAPVRSGVILLRSDLVRAADALGMGVRVAERAYVLRSLIAQDRAPVLRWIAAEAERQAERHGAADPALAPVADWWGRKAAATARLLGQLATSLRGGSDVAQPPHHPEDGMARRRGVGGGEPGVGQGPQQHPGEG